MNSIETMTIFSAGAHEAWVLETAGHQWTAKQIKGVYTIRFPFCLLLLSFCIHSLLCLSRALPAHNKFIATRSGSDYARDCDERFTRSQRPFTTTRFDEGYSLYACWLWASAR